jgi:hypothetical protein
VCDGHCCRVASATINQPLSNFVTNRIPRCIPERCTNSLTTQRSLLKVVSRAVHRAPFCRCRSFVFCTHASRLVRRLRRKLTYCFHRWRYNSDNSHNSDITHDANFSHYSHKSNVTDNSDCAGCCNLPDNYG